MYAWCLLNRHKVGILVRAEQCWLQDVVPDHMFIARMKKDPAGRFTAMETHMMNENVTASCTGFSYGFTPTGMVMDQQIAPSDPGPPHHLQDSKTIQRKQRSIVVDAQARIYMRHPCMLLNWIWYET